MCMELAPVLVTSHLVTIVVTSCDIPGTGRLAPGGVQFPRPAQHWLCLSKPPVGDRGSGVGDSREADT